MSETCKTCRFWGSERAHLDPPVGSCRVKAPLRSERFVHVSSDPFASPKASWPRRAEWPWSADDDWCGEHQPRQAGDGA